jgi:large subunit ribosomal protein L1
MVKPTKAMKAMLAKAPGKDPMPLQQAVELLKKFSGRKFDQTVEIHMNLGIDPSQADQLVRGSVVLPHGIGRVQRVIVFAKGDLAKLAEESGADAVGAEDLSKRIKEGWLDFDVCIATPDMMGKVEFRNDKGANIHAVVGKMSFDAPKLIENTASFISYVMSLKPNTVRGNYIKSIAICATMSPSIRVSA